MPLKRIMRDIGDMLGWHGPSFRNIRAEEKSKEKKQQ